MMRGRAARVAELADQSFLAVGAAGRDGNYLFCYRLADRRWKLFYF